MQKNLWAEKTVCVICFSAWENIEHRAPSLETLHSTLHCKICVLIASLNLLTRLYKSKNIVINNKDKISNYITSAELLITQDVRSI